jgi:hypothetical protein
LFDLIFAALKKRTTPYSVKHIISGIFMVMTLVWLTVSTPFVFADQQTKKEVAEKKSTPDNKEDNKNPFSNTTEEKTENGNSTLSEYLHETHWPEYSFIILTTYYKCHASDLYFAFHPELLSPPPEA